MTIDAISASIAVPVPEPSPLAADGQRRMPEESEIEGSRRVPLTADPAEMPAAEHRRPRQPTTGSGPAPWRSPRLPRSCLDSDAHRGRRLAVRRGRPDVHRGLAPRRPTDQGAVDAVRRLSAPDPATGVRPGHRAGAAGRLGPGHQRDRVPGGGHGGRSGLRLQPRRDQLPAGQGGARSARRDDPDGGVGGTWKYREPALVPAVPDAVAAARHPSFHPRCRPDGRGRVLVDGDRAAVLRSSCRLPSGGSWHPRGPDR